MKAKHLHRLAHIIMFDESFVTHLLMLEFRYVRMQKNVQLNVESSESSH